MSRLKVMLSYLRKNKYPQIARSIGVKVGENCRFLTNPYVCFGSEPYLVEIGDHVEITGDCRFITHDGGLWVLRSDSDFKKLDKFGRIKIGNNVFVGIRSVIMPGVTVGNNVVIGAGSLVTKSIPDGEVWAGVPAKKICTLDEYKEKVLKTADDTKGLSATEKEKAIREKHPDWF